MEEDPGFPRPLRNQKSRFPVIAPVLHHGSTDVAKTPRPLLVQRNLGRGRFNGDEAFLFFSNQLGCLGSIAVSLLVSLVLLKACWMM